MVKGWPCALHSLAAGETEGKEGPWVSAGFQEKPPGGAITGERSGLCDPGPGRGKGQEGIAGGTEPWSFLYAQSRKCTECWKAQCPVIEGSLLVAAVKIWTSVCEQWGTINEFRASK